MLSSNSNYKTMSFQVNPADPKGRVVEEINRGFKLLAGFFAVCMLGVAIFTVLRLC